MKYRFFVVFISLLMITSCGNWSKTAKTKRILEIDNSEGFRLAIISLSIKNSKDGFEISIPLSKIVDAAEKNTDTNPKIWNENDFVCFLLDKNKRVLDTLVLVQPLNPRYEYTGDNNAIENQILQLKETEVLLRFEYKTTMKFLQVVRVMKDGKSELLKTLEIQLEG
jgi:hypothetical protein